MFSTIAIRFLRALPIVAVVLLLSTSAARADGVDTLIKQLEDSSQKVRLAAALNLAKSGSEKAIYPLAKAVLNDKDSSVRAAAAVGLGKLIPANPNSKWKNLALGNLRTASSGDASETVRQQAANAMKSISGGGTSGSSGSSGGGKGGIYVNIGPMSSKTSSANNTKLRALMVKTAEKTMNRVAGSMQLSWPGGAPSKAALAKAGAQGFYVDGTLNTLDIKTSGSGATISCKVSMLLADFPDKSVFGFLNGGASVTASSSKSDQEMASEDCVTAVIENLIANKIVPTIKSKAP